MKKPLKLLSKSASRKPKAFGNDPSDVIKPHFAKARLLCEPKLSLGELYRNYTDADDLKKSFDVRFARLINVPKQDSGKPWKFRGQVYDLSVGITETEHNGHKHKVRVFYPMGEPLNAKTKVIVDCNCPKHCFVFEYANAQQGASFIYRCNGQPPNTTRPASGRGKKRQHRPGLCKHAIRCVHYLMKNQKKAANPKG